MLRRLLLVATSAICLGALAALALASLAASERDVLMAARRDLKTEAAAVEADWRRTGAELAQLSVNTAGDAALGFDVRALAAAVESYDPEGRLADALAQRIDSIRARLSERLLQFRHINPEVESVAIMNTDGQVLAANSARWVVGQSVLPAPGSDAPAAALPEFMLKGLTGTPQAGMWVEKNAVWWVSVAPIWARSAGKDATAPPTLAGVALLEQPLRSLPEGLGVSAFVMVDGDLLIGTPPKAMRALPPTPEPFLLAARDAHARLLERNLPFKPLFVNPGHVGIWAQRLHVPGTDRAHGAVMLDLTDLYGAMATRQLRVLCGTFAAWIVVAVMLFVTSRPRVSAFVEAGILAERASDSAGSAGIAAPVAEAALDELVVQPEPAASDADDGFQPLDLRDVPFEDTSPPGGFDDPLADPEDAVALVKSFMAGEPLGQTKAAHAVLGDLLDTVAGAPHPMQPLAPKADEDVGPFERPGKDKDKADKPLMADPEENTGPIQLPKKDALQPFADDAVDMADAADVPPLADNDEVAPPAGSSPQTEVVPPETPQGSARDQLMAMLQAKAKGAHAAARPAAASVPEPIELDPSRSDGGLETPGDLPPGGDEVEPALPEPAAPEDTPYGAANDLEPRAAQAALRLSSAQTDAPLLPATPDGLELESADDRLQGAAAAEEPAPPAQDALESRPGSVGLLPWDDASSADEPSAEESASEESASEESVIARPARRAPITDELLAPYAKHVPDEDADTQPAARVPGFGARPSVGAPSQTPAPSAPAPESKPRSSFFGGATPAVRPIAAATPAAADPYRKVYEDFVATRKACGESEDLPFGKFVQRLEATRADVLAKHGCADVEFSAYVKNGKAALKVTPK